MREMTSWKIGDIRISAVPEVDAGSVIGGIIPDATSERLATIPWLRPHFVDEAGRTKAVVQGFLVVTGDTRLLVDTCVGNRKVRKELADWNNLSTDFLMRLARLGATRETLNVVLSTHLHFDHVGWNTMLADGQWVPTFYRARHLAVESEFDYWRGHPEKEIEDDHAGFADSVLPVFEAGLMELVDCRARIAKGVSLLPTPGHTPSHVSVLVESGSQRAVITGDAIHHPCQIAHPEWGTISDTSPELARASRLSLLGQFADTNTLLIGSHFALPTGGRITKGQTGFRLIT